MYKYESISQSKKIMSHIIIRVYILEYTLNYKYLILNKWNY